MFGIHLPVFVSLARGAAAVALALDGAVAERTAGISLQATVVAGIGGSIARQVPVSGGTDAIERNTDV